MPKKSKENKNSSINKNLANLVIKELENENFDLKVLRKMQQAFAIKTEDRKAFVNLLDKKLSKEQLHKLNRAVVENANELMPPEDPNFVCRTTGNKIFQQLLLLEARHCGMKAKFNANSELQPLNVKDVPQEILSHYFILKQKFYPQKKSNNSVDSRIAQSINFLLYAPLFRDSEIYDKLVLKAAEVEHELQNPNGKYVQNLVEEKIADHTHLEILDENKPPKTHKNDKIALIVEESIKELEKNKEVVVKGQQREKINSHISKFLEEVSGETLTLKKNDLIDIIYQGLDKNQSKWSKVANYFGIKSYSISGESLSKVGKVINSETKDVHSPINPEIQKQLNQIVTELNKIKNPDAPILPSEVKKANSKKPSIPPKPKHLIGKSNINHK